MKGREKWDSVRDCVHGSACEWEREIEREKIKWRLLPFHKCAFKNRYEVKRTSPWKEENVNKRVSAPSPSPSSLSLSLSFLLSIALSLPTSLSLSNADVLHTLSHTNVPAFTRYHRIQRQEGERNLHRPEKNVSIQEEKRKCAKLSLSYFPALLFLPIFSKFSLFLFCIHAHLGKHPSEGGMSMSQHPSYQQPSTEPTHLLWLPRSHSRPSLALCGWNISLPVSCGKNFVPFSQLCPFFFACWGVSLSLFSVYL